MQLELLCVISLILVAVVVYAYKRAFPTVPLYATTPDDIKALLDPPGASEQEKLLARSIPNQRLIAAFGITSTFVSDDPSLHRSFVKSAQSFLSRDWFRLAEVTKVITGRYLGELSASGTSSAHRFDSLIQSVSLAAVLVIFFECDPDNLAFEDVQNVATTINQRWRDSKLGTLDSNGLEVVNGYFQLWCPSVQSPLNIIIPAFETMWRVVAVALAYEHTNPTMHSLCRDALTHPDDLSRRNLTDSYSICDVIQESLRLHPPTRHISRAVTARDSESKNFLHRLSRYLCIVPDAAQLQVAKADIEAVHMSPLWGPNSSVYSPARFSSPSTPKLFAFGYGSTACVARKWAPHVAGVLFATIMACVGSPESKNSRFRIKSNGSSVGGREGWDSWKIVVV